MSLPPADERNTAEIAYWNGPAGQRWVRRQQEQDALLAPVAGVLLKRAAPRVGEFVLDIGCGWGGMSTALAERVEPGGRVLGVDVSELMLARARELLPRGLPVEFVLGDATVHPFEPGRADLLISRFGVMFFADPACSFANIRKGLRSGARVAFACWREPRENPWLMLPLHEAYRHVPRLPETGPEAPGAFSFAAERRVRDVLARAGFAAIGLEPVDLTLDLALGDGLDAAVGTAVGIGPTSRALEGQPAALQAAATASIRAALAQHQVGNRVPLAGAIWIVSAKNP
ncbi:MAG TPA: methyltransferase domain-containing protein [Steroidobacteraceae bacterium]|nr:methyltransferase domain-containing protein [Steroidobacteraceae bacterium]